MTDIKVQVYSVRNVGSYSKTLKYEPVYGPVNSRRLGLSLGINPIQGGFACNWGCIYCQYGLDNIKEVMQKNKKIGFTDLTRIQQGLEARLKSREHYDSLTICGTTEPTLHPQFNDIVKLTVELRNRYRRGIPTSLFTNASHLYGLHLQPLDYVFMKLDAGNEETFKRFNRGYGITLEKVIQQISQADVKERIIQTMLCKGKDGNVTKKNIADYITLLQKIKPKEVHLYSLLYTPFPNVKLIPLCRDDLNDIAGEIESKVDVRAVTFIHPVREGEEFRF